MRFANSILVLVGVTACSWVSAEEPTLSFPLIAGYGGVVSLSQVAEQPRKGAKVVFDISGDTKPEEVNRGLESVARYLNLNAQAGNQASDVNLALVLHGGATKCALSEEAFRRHTKTDANPNLPLIRELKQHGVDVFVCGQSLARNKYSATDVASELTIAASAMTVNVNKQLAGYAYLSIH